MCSDQLFDSIKLMQWANMRGNKQFRPLVYVEVKDRWNKQVFKHELHTTSWTRRDPGTKLWCMAARPTLPDDVVKVMLLQEHQKTQLLHMFATAATLCKLIVFFGSSFRATFHTFEEAWKHPELLFFF